MRAAATIAKRCYARGSPFLSKSYPLARNDLNGSEFCGVAFSADGATLFVNIYSPGHVFAVTGPWARPSNAQP